jgi:histidyl-tRNA synthetase
MDIKAPRGTIDFLPGKIELWQYIQEVSREVFSRYGYAEISTPIFEHTELFLRGIGDTTDVVSKQMYTFTVMDERSFTLRPEGTASVVRSYLEHGLGSAPQPVKLFYIGPIFRYERPQKGRYRQFHQLGAEAIGSQDPALDVEMIAMSIEILKRLGLGNFLVNINSIGCPVCRPTYRQALRDHISPNLDKVCSTCLERFEKNPLRILDCKVEGCKEVAQGAPKSIDHLCPECAAHYAKVCEYLSALNIAYQQNDLLVRGLDYYTKTVYEVESLDLGAQSALSGGGRYDGLVEELGGPPTPGVGFAAGMERILLVLEEQGIKSPHSTDVDVFVISLGDAVRTQALTITQQLRQAGLKVETDYLNRSMKSQMKQANRLGARQALIIGEDELAKGVVVLRDMQGGAQEEVPIAQVTAKLCQSAPEGEKV